MWVVDTDYDEYALLCTSGTKGLGQDVHMASLYSTCPPRSGAAARREAWVVGGAGQRPPALLPASGRTQSPRAEVKEKFTAFAKAQGFTEDAIVFLPRNGTGCWSDGRD